MNSFIDITKEQWGLVDIDTYATQLHLFSKQKKLIFRRYLESQGIAIISLEGNKSRANLADKSQIEAVMRTLYTKYNLDTALLAAELDLEEINSQKIKRNKNHE